MLSVEFPMKSTGQRTTSVVATLLSRLLLCVGALSEARNTPLLSVPLLLRQTAISSQQPNHRVVVEEGDQRRGGDITPSSFSDEMAAFSPPRVDWCSVRGYRRRPGDRHRRRGLLFRAIWRLLAAQSRRPPLVFGSQQHRRPVSVCFLRFFDEARAD